MFRPVNPIQIDKSFLLLFFQKRCFLPSVQPIDFTYYQACAGLSLARLRRSIA